MNKKGMQVEIYKMIIVLIFISVTILIFSSFFSINSKFSRERQFVTFINDINIQAKSMIGSINKIEEISFKKIENIDKIYIVNMEADLSTLEFNENELLEENIHDKAVDNVFFFENNKMVYSGVVENLNIKQPHYICIEKMLNQIDIRFVGGSKGSDLKVINEENDCSYSLLTREIVTETFGEESKDDFIKKLDFFKKLSKNIDVGIKIDYEIEYDPYEDITKVKLKLTSENPIEDLEYFLKLPKCLLEEANIDSFVHSKSEVDTEILNVDPLVMWNFGAVDNEETETTFVKVGKISDICKELISYFAYAKETGIGTGIIESERSPYVDLDKDGKINNEDVYPDDGDNDAFPDSWELFFNYDINDPNVPDKHGDDDLDGATNLEEYNFDIDPKNEDSDQDGLLDGYEIDLGINPNDDDTDDDGMKDFYEVTFGLDPNNDDTENDIEPDGLNNYDEYKIGTNPNDEDSDNDGILDFDEIEKGTNPNDDDTDGDGIIDGDDAFPDNEAYSFDFDGDGFPDDDYDCKQHEDSILDGDWSYDCAESPYCYFEILFDIGKCKNNVEIPKCFSQSDKNFCCTNYGTTNNCLSNWGCILNEQNKCVYLEEESDDECLIIDSADICIENDKCIITSKHNQIKCELKEEVLPCDKNHCCSKYNFLNRVKVDSTFLRYCHEGCFDNGWKCVHDN